MRMFSLSTKLLTFFSLILLPGIEGVSYAQALPQEFSVERAREFTQWVSQYRKTRFFIGNFERGKAASDVFKSFETRLNEFMPGGPYEILSFRAGVDYVRLEARSSQTGTTRFFTLGKTTDTSETKASVNESIRFREATRMIIEERESFRDPMDGTFVTFTQVPYGAFDRENRTEVGRNWGPFTLSLLAKDISAQGDFKSIGAGANLRVPLSNGWAVSARAELFGVQSTRVQMSEGRFARRRGHYSEALVRLEIQRTSGVLGLKSSAGVKLRYLGERAFRESPIVDLFVNLEKALMTKGGREIGFIALTASQELAPHPDNWMVALMASFKF